MNIKTHIKDGILWQIVGIGAGLVALLLPIVTQALVTYPPGSLLQPGDVTSSIIRDGTILNKDIAPSANIKSSKLKVGKGGDSLMLYDNSGYIATSTNLKILALGSGIQVALFTNLGNWTWGTITYSAPSSQGAGGTVLTNNGSGALSWKTPTGAIAATGTVTTTTNTATTTLATVVLPANEYTIGNVLTMREWGRTAVAGASGHCRYMINVGNGTATTTVSLIRTPNTANTVAYGEATMIIQPNNHQVTVSDNVDSVGIVGTGSFPIQIGTSKNRDVGTAYTGLNFAGKNYISFSIRARAGFTCELSGYSVNLTAS